MKNFFRTLLRPVKNFDYFLDYYHAEEKIVVAKNVFYIGSVHFVSFLQALKAVHFLYLGFGSSCSDLENMIQFDAFFLLSSKTTFNSLAAIICAMNIYNN